ncbi:periostin, osteoblast specific factor b [Engraulis encrasicolus]|uniref:periostin, osteoblast specific factor b n=1 Tax=Engraulis encrasicolus TaxID=184585 RepID=UPI002FD2B6F3
MKLLFVAVFGLFVLSYLDLAESSAYDKIVAHSRIRAKKEGPNVCALQQVMGTKKKYFSTCRNWYQGAICGKKATVLYECCPGYMKLEGIRGCPAVMPIDNVYGTLGLIKAITTQDYSDRSELRPEIEGIGSYTFFAPSNEAWDLLEPEIRNSLVSNVNIELYNALHYHMLNRRMLTKDLKNGMTVTSMYNDLPLQINHYSNGIVTVNCARIIHANQVATNGVVHVIDRVVTAVGRTIQDVIETEDDLSSLMTTATASGLLDKLGEPGTYTLFAPTNEAFDKVNSDVLERIMGDKNALQALMNFHLLNTVQCSEAIMSGQSLETLEGNNLEIGCDGDSLTVNGVKMVLKKDIVTSNGVVHLIDTVLMPDSAKQVTELVGSSQSTFGDMLFELGLASAMRPEAEYTLLAPTNKVFTEEVMRMDQRMLKMILENHVLKEKIVLGQLYNGQLLETLSGKFLRVFIYRTAVCIENSCLVRGSKEGSNGALHLMVEFLKPAEASMYKILYDNGNFRIFLSLMEAAGLTDLLKQEGDFTLFAPMDDAFAGLGQRDIDMLMRDQNALRALLLYHFSGGVFIAGGLETGVTNLFKSLQGSNLNVRVINNSLQVNTVKVPESDIMATNGVVHFVKSLLYPKGVPVGSQELLTLLRRIIKYIEIRYDPGFRYKEIPLTFMRKVITRVVEREPEVTKITRVIEGAPTITKVTRVIEGEPSFTKVTRVVEGEPTYTKVTRVVEGDPRYTKVTRVIEGDPTMTRVVVSGSDVDAGGYEFSRISNVESHSHLTDVDSARLTKMIEEGGSVRRGPMRRVQSGPRRRTREDEQ